MADINEEFSYVNEQLAVIDSIKAQADFSHLSWSNEEFTPIKSEIREFYRIQQRGLCAFCKNPLSLQAAANCTVEHIIPKSKKIDFMYTPKNLCVICADCNEIKRAQEVVNEEHEVLNNPNIARYPRTSGAFVIVHPHFDDWYEHIHKVGARIYIDRTMKGINTMKVCKLNRFFHRFGVSDEYINDGELTALMSEYIESNNPIRKASIINRIREFLIA
ncbi:HNH endonuclease [Pectobacterium aroidearum]|uniref:HNH endonuclease n=1 Tax=Pectobacterium aroidearum TaxID=1201031 RepID=A0AAW3SU28_9GAMM|nr:MULTISPECIES: HNH endonuclease [Pectobacterium]MBA5198320.1 HNH endonuclease [Pectobacterium aroidearum]MBA5203640.1 HNH endonuclease [Pectobacterium aroidearum]MBA5227176.1 HNH endonuclease [Pectobacterium aroidearum]MBA5231113.1 HNH endonuclease [Pectobacterium aroidearum]MBA5736259.1 HNH endonuclease [Pectobacterium aroidearum]